MQSLRRIVDWGCKRHHAVVKRCKWLQGSKWKPGARSNLVLQADVFMQNVRSYIANKDNSCKFDNQLMSRQTFVASAKHWLRMSVYGCWAITVKGRIWVLEWALSQIRYKTQCILIISRKCQCFAKSLRIMIYDYWGQLFNYQFHL